METPESAGLDTQQWKKLITRCSKLRLSESSISTPFRQLHNKSPIPGHDLATLILTAASGSSADSLRCSYLEETLRLRLADTADILSTLLAHSPYATQKTSSSDAESKVSPPPTVNSSCQESVLGLITRSYVSHGCPRSHREARAILRALTGWLEGCSYFETMLQVHAGGMHTTDAGTSAVYEALGLLTLAILGNDHIKKGELSRPSAAQTRTRLAGAVSHFAGILGQSAATPVGTQAAQRLQILSRTPPLVGGDGKPGSLPEFSAGEVSSAVQDLPVVNSRAGPYVYLNAALCARPLTDDLAIVNYLHARYAGDTQSMVQDLIVASFDILANALHRHESAHTITSLRSFIANKLPLLLLSIAGPLTAEYWIQLAFGRIDVHPFPPLSQAGTGINETLAASRQDFLQACLLHGLVTDNAITGVLGQLAQANPPRGGRYVKEALVQQCTANVQRAEELVRELENMQGNAGAVSGAIVDTLQHLCETKETGSLRTLCSALSANLPSMDIILQYTQPSTILLPLCNLLNDWTHDEDQTEFQPPYEEFASVLLLLMATIHRYGLPIPSPSLPLAPTSFIPTLLTSLSSATSVPDLTPDQSRHLSAWITGLYAVDETGETSGISDETMRLCPPQSFYLLVPTLFEQSIIACRSGALKLETLKGGLEFLLEPFLLPSLVGGLSWLVKHAWESGEDLEVVVAVLGMLVRPGSISRDAKAMHERVLAIVAGRVVACLKDLERRMVGKAATAQQGAVRELVETLRPVMAMGRRDGRVAWEELREWCSTSNTGIEGSEGGAQAGLREKIKATVQGLIMWSSTADLGPIPYSYTHRLLLAATELLGAQEVLNALVNEVVTQTRMGNGAAAMEIVTALVCAPCPSSTAETSAGGGMMGFDTSTQGAGSGSNGSGTGRISLRQALKLQLSETKELLDRDAEAVETLIRLGRRVDAQSAVSQVAHLGLSSMDGLGGDMMQGIDMGSGVNVGVDMGGDAVAGAAQMGDAVATDFSDMANLGVDANSGMGNLDMGQMGGMNSADGNQMLDMQGDMSMFGSGGDFDMGMGSGQDSQRQGEQGQAEGGGQNPEDDIFASLLGNMDDMGDNDFNFD